MSQAHEVTFDWPFQGPFNVVVTGSFDNWSLSTPLARTDGGFSVKVPVPWGEKVTYKFVVDGNWVTSGSHPTEYDPIGNLNNIYISPPKPVVEVAPPAPVVAEEEKEPVAEVPLPEEDEVVAPTTSPAVEHSSEVLPEEDKDATLNKAEATPAEAAGSEAAAPTSSAPVPPTPVVSVEEALDRTPPLVEKNEPAVELATEPTSVADQVPAEEEPKAEPVYLAGAVQSPTEVPQEPVEAPAEPTTPPVIADAPDHTSMVASTVVAAGSDKGSPASTRPSTPPKPTLPLAAADSPSNGKATPPVTPKSTVSKATNGKDSTRKKRGSIFGKLINVFAPSSK